MDEKWKSVLDKKSPKSAIHTIGVMNKDFYLNVRCLIFIHCNTPGVDHDLRYT
jgi:hypothetical protein